MGLVRWATLSRLFRKLLPPPRLLDCEEIPPHWGVSLYSHPHFPPNIHSMPALFLPEAIQTARRSSIVLKTSSSGVLVPFLGAWKRDSAFPEPVTRLRAVESCLQSRTRLCITFPPPAGRRVPLVSVAAPVTPTTGAVDTSSVQERL